MLHTQQYSWGGHFHSTLSGHYHSFSTARVTRASVYLYGLGGYGDTASYSAVDPKASERMYNPRYAVGDKPQIVVQDGTGKPVGDGFTFLYTVAQRGLRDFSLSRSSTHTLTFSEDDIPNIQTRVVMFNGRGYREVYGPQFYFETATRKLNISVTSDRDSYAVQQEAKLTIKVTDQDGRGVRARVNLKAVDEAVASLEPAWQSQDILSDLYRYVGDGVFGTYLSHQEFGEFMGVEGGGGDGGRTDFRDVALFTEIETDDQGNGQASFKVPDNLTSWRIGATAVGRNQQAGQSTLHIPVTQSLFVVPALEDRMLSADRQHVRASVYGTALTGSDAVDVTFSLVDRAGTESVKKGKAFNPVIYELPALDPGDYQIRVSAKAKNLTDTVTLPLHVLGSNLRQKAMAIALLEHGDTPTLAPSGRTDLVMGDADRMLGYQILWTLLDNPHSRLDDAVASTMAEQMLGDEFDQQLSVPPFDPYQYQTETGLALYPLGSDDAEYAALAAGVAAVSPLRGQLITWFQSLVDSPKTNTEQVAYALYGLAQLEEPVLDQIRQLLSVADLPDREKLTLALALEALGATEEARPLASYLLEQYAKEETPYMVLELGDDGEARNVSTARFAILAAGLNLKSQYAFLRFALTHPPTETTTHLEQALAVSRLLAHASTGTVSVTYRHSDKTETKELAGPATVNLSLDATEASTFQITAHQGNVAVVSTYSQPFDPATAKTDPRLTNTRRYLVNGKAVTTFKRGDVIRVEFTWSKKAGAVGTRYGIVDYLPTGLRPLSSPWSYNRGYDPAQTYPYAIEHNRVKLYTSDKKKTFYYVAQAVIGGTALAEPPVLQAFDAPGSIQFGTKSTVTIGD